MDKPLVGILMGSDSDFSIMKESIKILNEFGIDYEVRIASAHRSPGKVIEYADTAEQRGVGVIIAGAAGSAHLAGIVAAFSVLPVIGVPISSSPIGGLDSLYSIVQMPAGVPVASVGINGAKNAGILAAEILSNRFPGIKKKLKRLKDKLCEQVEEKNQRLIEEMERLSEEERDIL